MDEKDLILGRILRRFIVEDEPGYDSPPYLAVMESHMTLDGKVMITPEERDVLKEILKEI